MNKKTLVLLSVVSLCFVGCEKQDLESECTNNAYKCAEGVIYRCDTDSSSNYWKPAAICYNNKCDAESDNNSECEKFHNCMNGNNIDGSCVCNNGGLGNQNDGSCINMKCNNGGLGNQNDGSCINVRCDNGGLENNEDGSCKNLECNNGGLGNKSDGSCKNLECNNGGLGNKSDGSCVNLKCNNSSAGNGIDGSCICPDECGGKCKTDGSCERLLECKNGYNVDGSCFCPDKCSLGCDDSGECRCPDVCTSGCDDTYSVCCEDNCEFGCDSIGRCNCSPECKFGCVPQEYNLCCKEKCVNGCSGTAKDNVKCDENECSTEQVDGKNKWDGTHNSDGSCANDNCIDQNNINVDGSCGCNTAYCTSGCGVDGSCLVAGTCIDECEDSLLHCVKEVESDYYGLCILKDINNNHMIDIYENLGLNSTPCRINSDCDSSSGANDGFCDSFIGNKCSTRCESDNECLGKDLNDGYNYVCRSDGRCAPDAFITVWSPELRRKLYNHEIDTMKIVTTNDEDKCSTLKICWDWNKDKDDESECETVTCKKDDEIKKLQGNDNDYYVIEKEYTGSDPYPDKELIIKIIGDLDGFVVYRTSNDLCAFVTGSTSVCQKDGQNKNIYTKEDYSYDLIEIRSFGFAGLGKYAFINCDHLLNISSVDIPNSEKLTNMTNMFAKTCSLSIPDDRLNRWDVSNVKSMRSAFRMTYCNNGNVFNAPLDNWNVSNVTDMSFMFASTTAFNQNIDSWNVSKVTTMSYMFQGAKGFNQNIGSWDVSRVTKMTNMFGGAELFNQDIGKWNVSTVDGMSAMFTNAKAFNQDIGGWNVSKVESMENMFKGAAAFNQNLNNWDVSKVTTMLNMFNGATSFNQNLSSWKPETIETAVNMFLGAAVANDQNNACKIDTAWQKYAQQLKNNYESLSTCGADKKQQCIFEDLLTYLGITSVNCE